jgi:hypothetical protein
VEVSPQLEDPESIAPGIPVSSVLFPWLNESEKVPATLSYLNYRILKLSDHP